MFVMAAVSPIFGHTYTAVCLFMLGFGSACAYLARVEDAIKDYGRPIFW
jgi:hypothetical protein